MTNSARSISLPPDKTRRAVGLVREGVTISCARTIRYEAGPDSPAPPIHYMVESGEGWASGEKVSTRRNQASVDFLVLSLDSVYEKATQ